MTTFHIDGDFLKESPVLAMHENVRLSAFGLWTLCGLWSAAIGSVGAIPESVVRQHGGTRRQVDELVRVGLWDLGPVGFQMRHSGRFIAPAAKKQLARAKPAADRPRGTRLPADFAITDAMREFHAARFAHVDIELETEKFVNYWETKSGATATKMRWEKVWQNWIITAAERTPKPAVKPGKADKVRSIIEQGRALDAAGNRRGISA